MLRASPAVRDRGIFAARSSSTFPGLWELCGSSIDHAHAGAGPMCRCGGFILLLAREPLVQRALPLQLWLSRLPSTPTVVVVVVVVVSLSLSAFSLSVSVKLMHRCTSTNKLTYTFMQSAVSMQQLFQLVMYRSCVYTQPSECMHLKVTNKIGNLAPQVFTC